MTAVTRQSPSVLDEAAAILEAEWIRLTNEEGLGEGHAGDAAVTEMPAARPSAPHVAVLTATVRPKPGPPHESPDRSRLRWCARNIWATQRSPPVASSNPGTETPAHRRR